jgi:hypothetical protein
MMNETAQWIPPAVWVDYFRDLRERCQGWRVTIEVLRLDLGDQHVAEGLPLRAFRVEAPGSRAGDIVIEAGLPPGDALVHQVGWPQDVWTADTQPGAEADILIRSRDGTATLVSLRAPAALPPPLRVDFWAPWWGRDAGAGI